MSFIKYRFNGEQEITFEMTMGHFSFVDNAEGVAYIDDIVWAFNDWDEDYEDYDYFRGLVINYIHEHCPATIWAGIGELLDAMYNQKGGVF